MTTDTKIQDRDEELGALLRSLEAPEHRAAFHAQLRARLADEGGAMRRRNRTRWAVRATAVAAAVGGIVALVGIPGSRRTPELAGPAPASAAVVKQHVRHALASLRTLEGVLVTKGTGAAAPSRWHFTLDAAGDFRLEGPAPGEVVTYDASSGTARSAQRSASMGGSTLFYAERTGVAPGPPDQGPPTWILPQQLGAYVRALLAAGDPAVREVVHDGSPAWRVDVDVVPNKIVPQLSGDHLAITVDRATGLPVSVVETKHGRVLRQLRIDGLTLDAPVSADAFTLDFPAKADVMRSDDGFRRVRLDAVESAVGYSPLVPSSVPSGFELSDVAVAREASPTGKEGGNPPSRLVVSLSYRRGFEQVLVTTRLRGAAQWSDPLASAEGFVDDAQTVRLARGALAGTDAHVVLDPRGTPHLWAESARLVVTVSGDLAKQQLVALAESLQG
jgi:hypothetical protein